jgi:hypothetical protein
MHYKVCICTMLDCWKEVVTPQVFSSIIALHLHKHKHASFMLFYVVATNVIVLLTSCDTR